MKELLRKEYRINILWKVVSYKQLVYREALEFDYLINESWFLISDRCKEFLATYGINDIRKVDTQKFFDTYLNTALKGMYAKGWKPSDAPWSSFIVFLSEKLHTDPLTILDKYTPEAISYLSEGIEWNINATSKEWQVRNERKVQAKKLMQGDKDEELASIKKKQELRKKRALQNNQ